MWRAAPFYLGLAVAPLLFGGVKPESQAVIGILFGLALFLTPKEQSPERAIPVWILASVLILIFLPLVPLPFSLVRILSPERARLAAVFSVDLQVPRWLMLSASPARAVQRLYEIGLALAAFVLARRMTKSEGASRRLAFVFAMALVLLGLSDIWSRAHGRESVLGLWTISWGKGAGTFANHNHFANWIYVASLYCAGWILQELFQRERKANLAALVGVGMAAGFALVMAFLSASRSGALAFVGGVVVFGFLLRSRIQRRSFGLAASVLVLGAMVVGLLAAEPLLHRVRTVSTVASVSNKVEIWQQTIPLIARFPLFGAGAGSFARVFNHYKSAHGDGTFWHAENDFIELFQEFGVPAAALILIGVIGFICRRVRSESVSPLVAGTIGALAVFGIHAGVEFVSYVSANLILAAALLGSLSEKKCDGLAPSSRLWPGFLAAGILVISVLQGAAWWNSWMSARAAMPLPFMERSLAIWPLAVNRNIGELRAVSKGNPGRVEVALMDERIERALRLDPLNWELRLEQVWFDLAFSTNAARTLSNAWLTVRLNPLQGQIPLRFAQHFAGRDPDVALSFLAAVHPGVPANHEAALELAWNITHDPAQLWNLTPNAVPTILNLIHFAESQKLHPIATEACRTLEGRLDDKILAEHYLAEQRPDEALRVLKNWTDRRSEVLRVQALARLNRSKEAVDLALKILSDPGFRSITETTLKPADSFSKLLSNLESAPNDPAGAVMLAEKIIQIQPLDLRLLEALAKKFPSEPRIEYLLMHAQLAAGNNNGAAESAARIVAKLP